MFVGRATSKGEFVLISFRSNKRQLIFAEIGQSHEGSIARAKSYVERAADSGADAIKVQIHLPEFESTFDEDFRPGARSEDQSRFEYWKRTSLTPDEWFTLREHARQVGLKFVPSAFSIEGLSLAHSLQPDAVKIGSGESLQSWFMEKAFSLGIDLVVSTGFSTLKEIKELVQRAPGSVPSLTLMQCVSMYPTPLSDSGVPVMKELGEMLEIEVGLSDHSGSVSPSIYALVMGASIVEVHVRGEDDLLGLDASSSVTFDDLRRIATFRDDLHQMQASRPKDEIALELSFLRVTFGRSVAPAVPIKEGAIIKSSDLAFKKPGGGLHPNEANRIIGKMATKNLSPTEILKHGDFA